MIELQTGKELKCMRIDSDGEYQSNELTNLVVTLD